MALLPGTRLGVYDITAQIGEGGMGQVFRATDTKLKRQVAIKMLPPALAANHDRLARFQREAEVLASLNHPNIAGIYGLEESGGTTALVMELVEGEDLSQRIARGALPMDEALPIARQIAEALDAAHEQGIVHRDLKPANIKVRSDGTVKVLDFGLAKAMEPPAGASPSVSMSPTLTTPAMTEAGMILGTAAYMSPEQAKGRPVDKRTDIWAFGAVVYEMLTGRRAFEGEDVSDTLARILMKEPEWTALPDTAPPAVVAVLRRCLQKDRKQRVRDIGDVLLAIGDAFETGAPHTGAAALAEPPPRLPLWKRVAIPGTAVVVASLLTGALAWRYGRTVLPAPRLARFELPTAPAEALAVANNDHDVAISPDGTRVVYKVTVAGQSFLAVRAMDELTARPLQGLPPAVYNPFISPDGAWVGFSDEGDGSIKKVSMQGGPALPICVTGAGSAGLDGASWGDDGTIVFATNVPSGLWQVPEGGGTPKEITKLGPGAEQPRVARDAARQQSGAVHHPQRRRRRERAGRGAQPRDGRAEGARPGRQLPTVLGDWPHRLRDRRHAPRRAVRPHATRSDRLPRAGARQGDHEGPEHRRLAGRRGLRAGPGWIPGLSVWRIGGRCAAHTRVDRQGHETPIAAPSRGYNYPRLSPDGTRVAVYSGDEDADIWVWDLARTTLTRVTFSPTLDFFPVWTPDGRRLAFSSDRAGPTSLFWQAADGTGAVERLTESPNAQLATAVSPDGRRLIFTERTAKANEDVMQVELDGTHRVTPLVQSAFNERNGVVSPDGRWLTYDANDSGREEIYVRPYPDVNAGHWQVSTAGGTRPFWARSGQELLYASPAGAIMRVGVERGTSWVATPPAVLVKEGYYNPSPANPGRSYDMSADGQRMLVLKNDAEQPGGAPKIIVVQHWAEELT